MSNVTREEVEEIVKRTVQAAFEAHEVREIENIERRIDDLRHEMVPGGQTQPHKSYHQSLIDAAEAQKIAEEERAKMYQAMTTKIIDRGIEGIFGALRVIFLLAAGAFLLKYGIKVPNWILTMVGVP